MMQEEEEEMLMAKMTAEEEEEEAQLSKLNKEMNELKKLEGDLRKVNPDKIV